MTQQEIQDRIVSLELKYDDLILQLDTINLQAVDSRAEIEFLKSQLETLNTPVYVSPSGNDITGDGSGEKPYASLNKAYEFLSDANGNIQGTIYLLPGEHKDTGLPSGSTGSNVSIKAAPGVPTDQVSLSGYDQPQEMMSQTNLVLKDCICNDPKFNWEALNGYSSYVLENVTGSNVPVVA